MGSVDPAVLSAMPKTALGAALAAALTLLAPGPAAAAPKPKMKAAYSVDGDGDGRVDGVAVTWSRKVRGGADRRAPFEFSVRGYLVTRVERASGRTQRIRVAERPECDIGASVKVRHRRQRLDMRRFDPSVPRITCAVTRDRDLDGRVDAVRLTYSRAVRSRAQTRGPFLFSVVGYRVSAVGAARGRFLQIAVAERDTPDSAATPTVGYAQPRTRGERPYAVRAGRGTAFPGTYQGTRDGAAPTLLAARTGDSDYDGLLDQVAVRFSEPVRARSSAAVSVFGMGVRSGAPAGSWLVLSLTEGNARGDARPGVWTSGAGLHDAAGNQAIKGVVAAADGAAPVMLAATTADAGGIRGRIDTIGVRFSEPVVHARDAGGAYPFAVAGRRVTAVEAAGGSDLQVRIAEATGPDTGARPAIGHEAGAGVPVTDAAGNQALHGAVTPADGVAPLLLSATTADADSDGMIDSLSLFWSETVQHGAEVAQSSFTVTGYGVSAAGLATGAGLALAIAESGSPDTGARPAVAYRRDGVADVRDAYGNAAADAALAQAVDGAAPVLLTARTADADGDARLDGLRTTWSEPLVHADDQAGPFPLSAQGFAVTRIHPASGATVDVSIAEPAGPDTGSAPELSYDGAGDPLRDAAGLEPARRSWPGLTVDALAPRLVEAATADGDGDGSLDSIGLRFSESVVHARELAQGSFTAGAFTIASAEAASGDAVELKLQESGAADSGARPPVGYAPDGQEDVRDATGNLAPAGTILAATDGARPVPLGAETVDSDDDGRLDGVATTWSEPLVHADDQSAPFPISAQGFAVTRVRAATGSTLAIGLEEPGAPDTGSAPTLAYDGGADPVRDASGLEPAQKAHAGLTRDALAPRLVQAGTADADFDGRIDAVELEWSEQVTGTTSIAPYAVSGRTLGGSVTLSGATTRIPFAEVGSGHDSDAQPAVSYDAAAGDLHDVAEGAGDTAAVAPAVAALTPADRAAPILVAAKTADLTTPGGGASAPNGTIDAVLTTFSEPIAHQVDGVAPYALNVAGRTETQIESDGGASDRTLYVTVAESGAPDGGYTPEVSVVATGPAADRIKDRSGAANDARGMTFSGTTDEVRPVLLTAQLGERGTSGGCTKAPVAGIDGQVDCAIGTWSEPVRHDADSDGTYPLSSSGWPVAAGGIGQLGPSATLEVPLTPAASPDRDRSTTTFAYDSAQDTPVVDAASPPNESLDGTRPAAPACTDTGREPNDTRATAHATALVSTSPLFERKCAFDPDWHKVETGPSGHLELVTRPSAGVDLKLSLVDSNGLPVTALPQNTTDGAAGQIDRLLFPGTLVPSTTYWAHVSADDVAAPQEGPYCIVYSSVAASEAGCGPLAGQLVFTEVGIGSDKFIEIKNDFEVPVDMYGAGAKLIVGDPASPPTRECTLAPPSADTVIDPGEHVLILQAATATAFGCNQVSSLAASGERLALSANGTIDVVDLRGVLTSPVAAEHSLQFLEDEVTEDHDANDRVATRWCRTFAAHTKGAVGDGCDEYRINEVLWKPAASSASSDGLAFAEIAGNLPAMPSSGLLGGWIVRGVNGLTGDGTADLVLGAGASPRPNGTYVVADGVSGATQVASFDHVWDLLDLNSPNWPDGTGSLGPRGLQLLHPAAGGSPPCTASADAFGWTATAQGFTQPLDAMRSCPGLEGQEYTNSTVGVSAARDNLADGSDTSYNVTRDSDQNRGDFCPQAPNPGALNIRPSC
jgi:hypothetical protein